MDPANPMDSLPAHIVRALLTGLVLAGDSGWPTATDALAATLRLGGMAALAACTLITLLACLLRRPASQLARRRGPLTPPCLPAATLAAIARNLASRDAAVMLRRVLGDAGLVGRGAGALALYGLVLAVSLLGTRTLAERALPEPVRELGQGVQPPPGLTA